MMSKNVIIFCRQEGCSGISYVGEFDTEYSAQRMSNDINVVARAAASYGLTTIVCSTNERPWVKNSLLYKDMLDKDVIVASLGKINDYIGDCIGVITLGIPAKAGTLNAFSSGTWNHVAWHDYLLDNVAVGEISIYKKYANSRKVPLIAVIGDEAVCVEAKSLDQSISVFSTKCAKIRNVAVCKDNYEVDEGIQNCVMRAIEGKENYCVEQITYPIKVTVCYNRTDFCDDAYRISVYSLDRSDARTLSKTINLINGIGDFVF